MAPVFFIGVLEFRLRKLYSGLCDDLVVLACCSQILASSFSFSQFLSLSLTVVNIWTISSSTASRIFLTWWGFSILVLCDVMVGIGKCPLPLRLLSSFSITNIVIATSTCCSTSRMYGLYTLQALAASSCDNLDFLVNSHDASA